MNYNNLTIMKLLIVFAFLLTTRLVFSSSTEENGNATHRDRSRSPRDREHQSRPEHPLSNLAQREDLSNGHLHPPPTASRRNLRIEVPSTPVNLPDTPSAMGRHQNQPQE